MSHHLRFTTGTRGEVHQHGVIVLIDKGRTYKLRSLLPLCLPIMEAFFLAKCDILLDGGTLGHSQLDLTDDIIVLSTDDSLDAGTRIAIYDVVLGQHVGSRNYDGTNLTKSQHDNPPLIMTLQNQHHRVILTNA